ncbi:hypothetical protein IG631_24267 [Alternaria alternata]|nr:hypothetical protein IG631_24267 [Alternaria alternata]
MNFCVTSKYLLSLHSHWWLSAHRVVRRTGREVSFLTSKGVGIVNKSRARLDPEGQNFYYVPVNYPRQVHIVNRWKLYLYCPRSYSCSRQPLSSLELSRYGSTRTKMTSRRGEMADYSFTSHNLVGGTSISDSTDNAPYKVSEHVLWAPRKMRVGSIGAGMSENAACGGVWYTNRYPGCRCDVPSHQYQFSFAPNPEWSSYYSTAEEIQAYFQNFAEKQGYIGKYIKLQHHVTKAVWHEEKGQWQLFVREMNGPHFVRDFEDYVDFLVGSFGILNTWKWPDIPNRESFKGHMIHSANYDASLNLKDLRVAVIGSGPTASQIVPSICETAKQVVSVSRTPQWVVKEIGLKGNDDITGHNFQCKFPLTLAQRSHTDI